MTGRPVAVIPATCRHGHSLAAVGYRASETRGQLRVTCQACESDQRPELGWTLAASRPSTIGAELDDAPYADLFAVVDDAAVVSSSTTAGLAYREAHVSGAAGAGRPESTALAQREDRRLERSPAPAAGGAAADRARGARGLVRSSG